MCILSYRNVRTLTVGAFLVSGLVLAPPLHAQTPADPTATGVSRAFNPALSINGLFLSSFGDGMAAAPIPRAEEGLLLQEVEMRLTSQIDPYSKADVIFSYEDENWRIEEATIQSSILPGGLGLRAGRMYVPVSRENTTHTHQLPFIQRSLAQTAIFEDGWSEVGAEVSWLAPTSWFLELRGGVFDGTQEQWFASADGKDLVYNGGLTSLWDLGESTTLQIDGGVAIGDNGWSDDATTRIASAGTTLRWRPTRRSVYKSLRWSAEYLYADRDLSPTFLDPDTGTPRSLDRYLGGWTSYVQYQFARRWWVQARWEGLDPASQGDDTYRWGALLAFVPSEFQALRLEVSRVLRPEGIGEDTTEVFLQYDFTIGSHPAHRY